MDGRFCRILEQIRNVILCRASKQNMIRKFEVYLKQKRNFFSILHSKNVVKDVITLIFIKTNPTNHGKRKAGIQQFLQFCSKPLLGFQSPYREIAILNEIMRKYKKKAEIRKKSELVNN